MSDETTQAEPVEGETEAAAPVDESADQSAFERDEVRHNDQAIPSIETWEAPWEGNLNQPFPIENEVSRAEKRHATTG